MNIHPRRPTLPRRTFLKGAGETPRRAVFAFYGLGINGRDFTPADTGLNCTMSPILKPLDALRREFTVISGLKLSAIAL